MQLNIYRRSYPSQKVLCATRLLEVDVEIVDIDLMSESSWPFVERLSYWGRLPVLVTSEEQVNESANIVEYLAVEANAVARLYGDDDHQRRRTRHQCLLADLYLGAVVGRYFHHLVGWAPLRPERVAEVMVDGNRAIAWLSGELKGRKWLGGNEASASDLCWVPAALAAIRELAVDIPENVATYSERALDAHAFSWLAAASDVGFPSRLQP